MMGKIETTKFDSADYLDSAEAIAAYLDAYLEDATPEELRNALATVARSHCISDLARRSGVSRPGIYKALGEDEERSHAGVRGEHRSAVVRDDPVDTGRDGVAVDG
jgi:probable addiction module antidote protein